MKYTKTLSKILELAKYGSKPDEELRCEILGDLEISDPWTNPTNKLLGSTFTLHTDYKNRSGQIQRKMLNTVGPGAYIMIAYTPGSEDIEVLKVGETYKFGQRLEMYERGEHRTVGSTGNGPKVPDPTNVNIVRIMRELDHTHIKFIAIVPTDTAKMKRITIVNSLIESLSAPLNWKQILESKIEQQLKSEGHTLPASMNKAKGS
tara:strand:- start:885 stop:1499 length:615 start_codon:yes stop_codon:yes gene_type:complete